MQIFDIYIYTYCINTIYDGSQPQIISIEGSGMGRNTIRSGCGGGRGPSGSELPSRKGRVVGEGVDQPWKQASQPARDFIYIYIHTVRSESF